MSEYIDSAYVGNAIGITERDGLTGSSTQVLTQLVEAASALVDAVLSNSGYSVPLSGTIPDIIKSATLGALLPQLYGRKGLTVPEPLNLHINVFEKIRTGDLPLVGQVPEARDAVGGSKFSGSSTTVSGDKPQIFKDLRTLF